MSTPADLTASNPKTLQRNGAVDVDHSHIHYAIFRSVFDLLPQVMPQLPGIAGLHTLDVEQPDVLHLAPRS